MIQKLKLIVLSFYSLILFAAPLAIAGVASADSISQGQISGGLCAGSKGDFTNVAAPSGPNGGQGCTADNGTTANSLVTTIINVLSLIVGTVAVIMLIIGGFRYVTSGGKQESVTGAKNTILYALIGLVIVALAQIVVHFVLHTLNDATSGTAS